MARNHSGLIEPAILLGGVGTHLWPLSRALYHKQLPPRSPELSPVENIWWFLRGNWLSNCVSNSYEDILDHCYYAWNQLAQQPCMIMSIGLRDWDFA